MDITIIQAIKKIKHLGRRIDRVNERIQRWCSYVNDNESLYTAEEVRAMIQSVGDMQKEIGMLRHAIHLVNATVAVDFEGNPTTIDELLIEATVVIPAMLKTQKLLRRVEKNYNHAPELVVVTQFDPKERDKKVDSLTDRQGRINDFLDTVNIQTKL